MSGTLIRACVVVPALLAMSAPAESQWLTTPTPGISRTADGKPDLTAPAPRTADGGPDLSGIWRVDPGGYTLNLVSSLKASDVMPWAEALFEQRSEEFSKDHPGYRCMPEIGPFYSLGIFKVLQSRTTTAILSELGVYRQILTDGRALPEDPNPTWMGYSVGRWEGGTFVVESAGFNDRTWLDFGGHPHTEALRVTERYRRADFGHMHVEMTFEDPKAYARPWTISLEAEYVPDTELLEFVCNENERSLQHFVVTDEDRRKAKSVVQVAPEILARYVGSYDGTDERGRKMSMQVTLDGDRLMVNPPSGGGFPLTPESDTRFSASGAPVVFQVEGGVVKGFVVHAVEGDMNFNRKETTR